MTHPRRRRRSQIAAQHRSLRETLGRIASTGELAQLVRLLEDLRAQLEPHFAEEEAPDGLAEAVGAAAPQHLRHLDRLMAEHRVLLVAVDGLITRGQALLSDAVGAYLGEVRALSRRLREHEEQETALLSEAVHADIGSG
jgi:hypothetical protein